MTTVIFSYLLKLSISLGIIFLFYHFVLQKLTFYNWNRWYLLTFTILSFLIPLIDISALWKGTQEVPLPVLIEFIPPLERMPYYNQMPLVSGDNSLGVGEWLLFILLTGISIMLIRTTFQIISIIRIRRMGYLISDKKVKIYQVDAPIQPFSFGRSIFLNRSLHPEEDLTQIIRHELVHVQQGHTADIIWMELVCILNWYNPFVWLLRQQLRQNLEFIADNQVLQSGINKKYYQYLLLQVNGNAAYGLANQFNFSSLKNRINMMNKMPSARPELGKYLFLLPLVALLLLSFRGVDRSASLNENLIITTDIGRGLTDYLSGNLLNQKEPKNLVTWKPGDNKMVVAIFQDGTQETYDLATEEGKQKMQAAQLFLGDAYSPENLTRTWPEDFKIFLTKNPQISKIRWRYDMAQIQRQLKEKNFFYPADRLYLTLQSGVEEVYAIENKFDLDRIESKFGKLPMLPPPPPTLNP